MANIFDIADKLIELEGSMSTMKLQKLCYYSQAWSLAWTGSPLFNEDFQAWANGPVCPELFNYHKGQFKISSPMPKSRLTSLTEDQLEIIMKVYEDYGDDTGAELSVMTHQEKPWLNARKGSPEGARSETIISQESMKTYYSNLLN